MATVAERLPAARPPLVVRQPANLREQRWVLPVETTITNERNRHARKNPAVLAAPQPPSLRARSRRGASRPGGASLQALSRAGVGLLLLLAVANGVFLYLLPAHAEARYAWAIAPPINAAFMGAGYLAGTVATALVVFATRSWRSLRVLPLPLVVLSVGLLAATLMHADRFRWDYPLTWVWTGVYARVPLVVAALWLRQERVAPAAPAGASVPAPPAAPLRRDRRALVAGSLALFAAPGSLAELWPWPLTDLLRAPSRPGTR